MFRRIGTARNDNLNYETSKKCYRAFSKRVGMKIETLLSNMLFSPRGIPRLNKVAKHTNHLANEVKISICIPVFLRQESDLPFLRELLQSIRSQSFKQYEVVLCEDSKSRLHLQDLDLTEFGFLKDELTILKSETTGISANTNSAVRFAKGKYIKLMFQDDLFAHPSALKNIFAALEISNKKWLLCGSDHLDQITGNFGPIMVPKLRKTLFEGINSVSSPSVVAFDRDYFLDFSNLLSLMMDCEWYIRMVHNFGQPIILRRRTVINRLHTNQAQHSLKTSLKSDLNIVSSLHSTKRMGKCRCLCRSQK